MAAAPLPHFSEERDNYLRMNLLLTKISSKAVRVLFNKEFNPTCLYDTIEKELSRLNDLKKKHLINSSQWSLLFPSNDVPDSKHFDILLMITLLRNLLSLPAPVSGYDQLPLSTDTTPTDDVTRIEYYKTKLANFRDGHMGSSDFSTAWEDMIGAIGRLGGSYMVAECDEMRTKQLYHSTQDSEKRIDEDGENLERYSRVSGVIIDTFQNILRDIIRSSMSASKLYQRYLPQKNYFTHDQQTVLDDANSSNSYDSLDFKLIYRLLRQFCMISPPTKGWGSNPENSDMKLADDVERIRRYRDHFTHRCNANIGKDEFDDFFDQFRAIGIRMDRNFFQKTSYERWIIEHKTCTMTMELKIKYKKALKQLEHIKLQFQKRPLSFYWSNSWDDGIGKLRYLFNDEKLNGKEKIRLKIIFQNEEDIEKNIDILKSFIDEENESLSGIEFMTVHTKARTVCTDSAKVNEDQGSLFESCKIPEQIKKMDRESIDIYLNALESGSERRRDINLIIVGKKGVGKTSLIRRMFGEELKGIKKTNGIEIHRRRCQINLSDMEWKKVPDTTLVREKSINNRIMQVMIKTLNHEKENIKRNNPKNKAETSLSDMTETDENEETVILKATTKITEHSQQTQPKMNYELDIPQITEISFLKHERELSSIIKSDIDSQDDDSYAMLTVWDFAGDIEYYNTHQTFLNPEAIYLVVASLHDIDDTDSYGTFNFWMDTIHCYGNVADKNRGLLQSDGTDNFLDPPVIAIGTHKDKFQDENQCRELLASYTDTIFKDSKLHLRSTYLLSNTNDKEQAFRKLRNEIFTTASKSQNWNREYPVKFLQIEKAMNSELTTGKQIIPFDRVKELGANISIPITDNKELRLFLRFQHEVGNLIYYEDIPSYIILDPQWLVNAFKCIVTAQQFQLELPHLQWEELKQTGKMDLKLLDAIFKKQSTEMTLYKEHVLEVIEKFDIIIHPFLLSENGKIQKEACFYVPCMIQTSKIENIDKVFNVPDSCKSTCLCFVFRFLPPHLISNLFVSCLRVYSLATVKGQLGISKDSCVFNISKTGCEKFVLSKNNHMIELQIWQWGKPNLMKNQEVLQFVEIEINRIVNTRYKLKTVSFEKKWKCETTSYSFEKGFHELDDMLDGENYYCEEHATLHRYEDHWSGEKTKVPCELSNEQRNFTRLSMIVLDILRSVLYERLNLDKSAGQLLSPSSQYDITSLYQEHRKLNIHIPSKGRWGGGKTSDDILPNDTCIGDDIERIRLIRNEMQHSTVYALSDTRYHSLITTIEKVLTGFDHRNNPTGDPYVNRLQDIRKIELETRNLAEIKKQIKAELQKKINEFFVNLEM